MYLLVYPSIGVHAPYKSVAREREHMSAGNTRTKAVLWWEYSYQGVVIIMISAHLYIGIKTRGDDILTVITGTQDSSGGFCTELLLISTC